jgi:hypothetical protein
MAAPTEESLGFDGIVARIRLADNANNMVNFDYNPQTVEISRESKTHSQANGQPAVAEGSLQVAGNLILNLYQCRFVGANLEQRMDQLLSWAAGEVVLAPPSAPTSDNAMSIPTLKSSLTAAAKTGPLSTIVLPKLAMTWGTTERVVQLQRVTVTFDQYSTQGVPLAATVTMTMIDVPQLAEQEEPQNPTSGGIPGRSSHVMVTGEDLIGLATQTYGAPRYWKPLAQANNIDDPLRVGAGRQIYLPSPSEI